MMKPRTLIPAGLALLLVPTALAQETRPDASPFALSIDAGTTGLGGSLWITASDHVTLTLGYAAFEFDDDYSTDEADYAATADLANAHALLNWHPWAGGFHLSAGAILADNQVDAVATPASGASFEFNGIEYPATLVGNLTADGELADGVVPYAGLGWSSRPRHDGWGMFATIGAMFSGSVEVALAADGPLASDPLFQQNLALEEQELQDELDQYEIFPVVRVGVMFRF